MWACQSNWYKRRVGKYHWFEKETKREDSMHAALCDANYRIYPGTFLRTKRAVPRHADRCKRCVAVLKRREDEDAKG